MPIVPTLLPPEPRGLLTQPSPKGATPGSAALGGETPSPADLLMAAATMHSMGRLPKKGKA